MNTRLSIAILVAALLSTPASSLAQKRTMSLSDRVREASALQKVVSDGTKALHQQDYRTATTLLMQAKRKYESFPPDLRRETDVMESAWYIYAQLGYVDEARQLFESMPADISGKYEEDWNALKSTYGTISLKTEKSLLSDVKLRVETVRFAPKLGTSGTFPFELVRQRAEAATLAAFRNRDLLTNPIYLPGGDYRMEFALGRESGLDYKKRNVEVDFQVVSGESREVNVVPGSRGVKPLVLAGLLAGLTIPFMIAN